MAGGEAECGTEHHCAQEHDSRMLLKNAAHLSRLGVKLVQRGQDEHGSLTHTGFRLADDVYAQDSLAFNGRGARVGI